MGSVISDNPRLPDNPHPKVTTDLTARQFIRYDAMRARLGRTTSSQYAKISKISRTDEHFAGRSEKKEEVQLRFRGWIDGAKTQPGAALAAMPPEVSLIPFFIRSSHSTTMEWRHCAAWA